MYNFLSGLLWLWFSERVRSWWSQEVVEVPRPGITCRMRVGNLIIEHGGGVGGNSLRTVTTAAEVA